VLFDPSLPIICEEIAKRIPARSIYLCGSRAIGQGISESSDYDIGVVMNTFLIPVYLRRIKSLEKELSQKLGLNLVINPLPTFRVHRAKGNLFLFKLKREGITLWGKDYIKSLDTGDIEDIGADWYFSYLFSAMKNLIRDFDPPFISNTDEEQSKMSIQGAAKAVLYCGEIFSMMDGHYETRMEDGVLKLSSLEPQFLEDLKLSLDIRRDFVSRIEEPFEFWIRARGYLLDVFQLLMHKFKGANSDSLDGLAIQYLNKGNKWPKNLQYFALTWLLRKEMFAKGLWSRRSVEDRIHIALLWLLCSLDREGHITRKPLTQAYDTLKGYIGVQYPNDDIALWRNIKSSIITYWPVACTVMGL
jgi:predicted nucleotidyltransferase